MALRCILIPTAPGIDATHRLNAALRLGRRIGAHVRVMFISPEPELFLANLPVAVRAAGVTVTSLQDDVRAAAAHGKAAFNTWCTENDVKQADGGGRIDAVFATWDETVGELETVLALAGRVTDITILDKPESEIQFTERAFDTAVFSSGRPVLVLPERTPEDLLCHVVIAWNGSLEAARIIGQSIDLLHQAERVSIIQVDSNHEPEVGNAGLRDYLRWHGIVTRPLPIVVSDAGSLGQAILTEASRNDATLLVMGAYTHSRIRQFLLGGVTRHVLDHAAIPVLMAH